MSLASQLTKRREESKRTLPAEVHGAMLRATAELGASGIVDRAPKKGDVLRDFALPNQSGETRRLSDLVRKGPVVITFYRGGWCPYCNLELRAYQRVLDELDDVGATLVAITPELPDASLTTAEKNELAFEVLSDTGSAYARELGLVFTLPEELRPIYLSFGIDVEQHNGSGQFDLPLAATFVVDRERRIISSFVHADYTERQEPAEVVAALRAHGGQGH